MNQLTRSVEIKMRHLKSFNFAIALSRSFCPWFPVKMLNQNSINYCWPDTVFFNNANIVSQFSFPQCRTLTKYFRTFRK